MMNRTEIARAALVGALIVAAAGCGKKETKKPQASAPAGAGMVSDGPSHGAVTLSSMKFHAKVQFPEERLPNSQDRADAVAGLASALAGGSADGLGSLVGPRDRMVLEMLVKNGQWKRQSDSVKVVRVCVVDEKEPGTFQVGLGVEDAGGAFLMGWDATKEGEAWTFSNMAIEPKFASHAGALDGSELKLLELPSGRPVQTEIKPIEQKKDEEGEEGKKSKPRPSGGGGGGLKRERN